MTALLDPHHLLATFGALALLEVLYAETGLLVGFLLPGDSLLFTAGVLCATGSSATLHLSLPTVLVASLVGVTVGAQVGHLLGRWAGPSLLDRPDRTRLHEGTSRARAALEHYGVGRALVLARFIPIVRTVINPLAGAVGVSVRVFAFWQVLGGTVWVVGLVFAGYVVGGRVPNIDHYLLPVVAVVVLVSLSPVALEIVKARRRRATVAGA
jgi:membrane-associated protein